MAKSVVARGASMAASVWGKLDGKVKAKGGTEDAIHILDKPEGDALLNTIANLLAEAEQKTRDRFPITIDFNLTLEQMITECGCDYNNPNIATANFQITGNGKVEEEIILIHFNRDIGSEEAIEEMWELGLEPAGLVHAPAFGKKFPDKQREFPIVFLGSSCVIGGHRYVPYLSRHDSERDLDLYYFSYDWLDCCRFAAVRTKKK